MKLLFDARVLTHTNYTGVENYTDNLLDTLKKTGVNVNTVAPKSKNRYLAHLWTHFVLPFKDGEVLFCPANVAPLFAPKSKKLVVTIHDVAFLAYPKSFSSFFRIYYRLVMPFVVRRADRIITVSQYSRNEIEKYYPDAKGKIEVVYLGVQKEFQKIEDIKKKNQLLYVGSMNERKNFIGVLKAFELLDKKDYKLLIVGNFSSNFAIDESSRNVIKSAQQNKNVEFKNNVCDEELVRMYNESKLFIFPSFYEGFGLPVLEAMACGTPVVCSATSSLPEVGGDSVVYCDPYEVSDIKKKIVLVLDDEDLQKQMSKKGLDRAKEFSWQKSADWHIKIFEDVHAR